MTLSAEIFSNLHSHWAVGAVGEQDRERATQLAQQRLVQRAVGEQIKFSFESASDEDLLLDRVALAYELAALEGLDILSGASAQDNGQRDLAMAGAFCAFDLRRLLPVPNANYERLFYVLHLAALAYIGDRGPDLRRWFKENTAAWTVPSVVGAPWDHRILYRLFDGWIRLFRQDGWDDLDRIREIIAGLRSDQKAHEEKWLRHDAQETPRARALRLIALYHWAKVTEILALYMLQGEPTDILAQLDKHFEAGIKAAVASADVQHEGLLRWLHAAGRIMVQDSLWWATRAVSSTSREFVRLLVQRSHQPMFELLPPQRTALLEQGLLDLAKTAIVVDLPTSGGKTLLAQFRILQALNQFRAHQGWVAYVAPTRALATQLTRRLRRDFAPINIRVEQLTAAIEVDAFEDQLLASEEPTFDVLIATPEKLSMVIQNKKVARPMALLVMDEAHNLETEGRGLRIELLLATVKRDCPQANFLLLMPFVEDTETIARWLAQDESAGQSISLGTIPWKPNERIIGLYRAVKDTSVRAGWHLEFETLGATEHALPLRGIHRVGETRPLSKPRSQVLDAQGQQKGVNIQTAAIASILSQRQASNATCIAITNRLDRTWQMARDAMTALPAYSSLPDDIQLVQDFLKTEISPDFELISMLNHGVGIHHAGLSDDVRSLMEWLAETGHLRVLCATTTIAQGINFPVSSVVLASRFIPQPGHSIEMPPREFWNLAGRAGRIHHESVGVIGLAEGQKRDEIIKYVHRNTGALVSRLVSLLDELEHRGELDNLSSVIYQEQWDDFRRYIAHLWAEKKNLEAVLEESEYLLRQTLGYRILQTNPAQRRKAEALLNATRTYAEKLAGQPGSAQLADATGFSPEGVNQALNALRHLPDKLVPSDWTPNGLFGNAGKIATLYGVMLQIRQLKPLTEISTEGSDHARLSNITRDWVNGKAIRDIAQDYFSGQGNETQALTDACRAIYRTIVNNGTWGLAALSRVSDLDFDRMTPMERHRVNALPAMIYHGVRSEDAVLMRMNAVPRSAAENLGRLYRDENRDDADRYSVQNARAFLQGLDEKDWELARPVQTSLSGESYKRIWGVLSGEQG